MPWRQQGAGWQPSGSQHSRVGAYSQLPPAQLRCSATELCAVRSDAGVLLDASVVCHVTHTHTHTHLFQPLVPALPRAAATLSTAFVNT